MTIELTKMDAIEVIYLDGCIDQLKLVLKCPLRKVVRVELEKQLKTLQQRKITLNEA